MVKSTATSLILRGVLAIAVGIIALAWPGVRVLALVILFAVYAFIGAGLRAMLAFSSNTAGPVFGHLLLGGGARCGSRGVSRVVTERRRTHPPPGCGVRATGARSHPGR